MKYISLALAALLLAFAVHLSLLIPITWNTSQFVPKTEYVIIKRNVCLPEAEWFEKVN